MPESVSERRSSRDAAPGETTSFRESLDLFCERGILVLVLAILVWSPLAMAAVRVIDFVPVEAMTALALGLWIVRFWTQRPFRLFWPPVCWAVYAFVLYAVARCRCVDIHYLAWREMLQVIVYAVLFFVIVNNLNRRESAEIVTVVLIGLGAALSVFALYQFSTHSSLVSWLSWVHRKEQYIRRGSGTFINPNNFGGYVAMLIPVGLAQVLLSRMKPTAKVVIAYACLMLVVGVCVSMSRGAIAGAGAASVLMCLALLFRGSNILPAAIGLAFIIGIGVVINANMESLQRRFARTEGTNLGDERLFYWQVAAQIIRDHKIWGAGPAHFDSEFFIYRPAKLFTRIRYAHNEYLNTLADWGAVGLGLIGVFLGALGYGAWRSWSSVRRFSDLGRKQTDKGSFVLGASFAIVALAIHCFVDFDMHIPADALLAVALMALLAAHQRFVTENYWRNPGSFGKFALTGVAACAFVFLGAQAWGQGHEQSLIEAAHAEKRVLDRPIDPNATNYEALAFSPSRAQAFQRQVKDLQEAFRWDPSDEEVCFDLGDALWSVAVQGGEGTSQKALQAMDYYSYAIADDPLDAYAWMHYGMGLDWLGRHRRSDPYFRRALSLDPMSWYVMFYAGRHFVDSNQLEEAKKYFTQAWYFTAGDAHFLPYLHMVDERLAEAAKHQPLEMPSSRRGSP